MNKVGRVRVSTAIGYLSVARVRPNLTVRGLAPVQRLVVADGRVVACEVETAGGIERIEGRLFVLCAGAIASPALLERSGVGRPDVLGALGVDVVADVPGVGENLADHPACAVVCAVRPVVELDVDAPIVQTVLRYTAPGSEYRNDLQIEAFSFWRRRLGAGAGVDGEPCRSFGIAGVLEHCWSRGSVHLSSVDGPPVIDSGMCADQRDVERLAACYIDTIAFTKAPSTAEMIEEVSFPRLPVDMGAACELVRRFSASGYHPCGTVRMGPRDDPMAVVDQYGRCHAVDRLVVADASIFPTVPRANTNLTAIMVGEKVGEWLRTSPTLYGL